jgi:bifunctional N-acetylglucosamine-1-phosphate-uridyltransferase/glucosamine-1-phosphate-acetyltransferase GlmU-like protein
MGKISGQLADFSIFTVEDSRSENIFNIFRLMKKDAKNYVCIPERGEAISYALSIAKKGDVIGIFGKGHEKTLAYFGYEHPWNDKAFVLNQLNGYENLTGVVLAGGKGKRMNSNLPKIMHRILGRPLISYSLKNLRDAGIKNIIPVVGYKRHIVLKWLSKEVNYAIQSKQLGTGNAVLNAFPKISEVTKDLLVINGDDSAFYKPTTIKSVIEQHRKEDAVLTFVSLIRKDPSGLGRVIRGSNGDVLGTVEEKNATDEQKKITEVNDGLYIFNYKWLVKNILNIKKDGISKEYYLTDLIKIAIQNNEKVSVYKLLDAEEWQGINTPSELKIAEEKMIKKII